jgi:hypothetical protein
VRVAGEAAAGSLFSAARLAAREGLDFCSDERKVWATRRERGGEMNSVQAGELKLEVMVLPVSIRMAAAGCFRRSRRVCRVAEELPR